MGHHSWSTKRKLCPAPQRQSLKDPRGSKSADFRKEGWQESKLKNQKMFTWLVTEEKTLSQNAHIRDLRRNPQSRHPGFVQQSHAWLCLLLPLLNSREQQREVKGFCLGLDTSPQLGLDMTQPWPSCPWLSQAGDQGDRYLPSPSTGEPERLAGLGEGSRMAESSKGTQL